MRWTPPLDFAEFRLQETRLIVINVGVMLALMGLHALFQPAVAPLSLPATEAFIARLTMQGVEAFNLNRAGFSLGPLGTRVYSLFSIVMNVAFTAVVAVLCGGQESHYAVLFVVPVIAAAFRESILGLSLVLAVVSLLTVGLVWVPLGSHAPAASFWESFAAISVSLIFLVVASVVRIIAVQLWSQRFSLERAIADLAATRDRLVREEKLAAVGRLSAAIAHEVRNPVSMISSAVSMARDPATAAGDRAEVLGIVYREAHRLERLTTDFLTYARERAPELRSTTLGDTLEMIGGLCRPRAEEAGVTLSTSSRTARPTRPVPDPAGAAQHRDQRDRGDAGRRLRAFRGRGGGGPGHLRDRELGAGALPRGGPPLRGALLHDQAQRNRAWARHRRQHRGGPRWVPGARGEPARKGPVGAAHRQPLIQSRL